VWNNRTRRSAENVEFYPKNQVLAIRTNIAFNDSRSCPADMPRPCVRAGSTKRSQQARSILLHTHQKIRDEERDQPGQSRKHCFRLVPQSKDKEWE
jgi:hypothetical protein